MTGKHNDRSGPQQAAPVGDVRLQAPTGVVIDYTLPLHETIDQQWRKGELSRVDEDGILWEGDQYDVSGVRSEPATAGADGEPVRPADGAPKKAWQDYAVATRACSAEEAAGMTRADLIAKCTPPEMDPLAPEV
jgi:hypothetical protein